MRDKINDMFKEEKIQQDKRFKFDKSKVGYLTALAITSAVFVDIDEASADTYSWDKYDWVSSGYTDYYQEWVPDIQTVQTGTRQVIVGYDTVQDCTVIDETDGFTWCSLPEQVPIYGEEPVYSQVDMGGYQTFSYWVDTSSYRSYAGKVYDTLATKYNATSSGQYRNRILENYAPVIQNTALSEIVYKKSSFDIVIDGYDEEGDTITYSIENHNPDLFNATISGDTVTVTGVQKGIGTITLKVTSTNDLGFTESNTKTFTVDVRNNPPKLERLDTPNHILLDNTKNYTYTGLVSDVEQEDVTVTLNANGVDFTQTIKDNFGVVLEGNKLSNGFTKTNNIKVNLFDGTDNVPSTYSLPIIKVDNADDYQSDMENHDSAYNSWSADKHEKMYNAYIAINNLDKGYSHDKLKEFDQKFFNLLGITTITDTITDFDSLVQYNEKVESAFNALADKSTTALEWFERRNNMLADYMLDTIEVSYVTEGTDLIYSTRTVSMLNRAHYENVKELVETLTDNHEGYTQKSVLAERVSRLTDYHNANDYLRSLEQDFKSITWGEGTINIESTQALVDKLASNSMVDALTTKYADELNKRIQRLKRDFMNIKEDTALTLEDFEKFLSTEGNYANNTVSIDIKAENLEYYKEFAKDFKWGGVTYHYLGEEDRMYELVDFVNTYMQALSTFEPTDITKVGVLNTSLAYLATAPDSKAKRAVEGLNKVNKLLEDTQYSTRKTTDGLRHAYTGIPLTNSLLSDLTEAIYATIAYNNLHINESMTQEELEESRTNAYEKLYVFYANDKKANVTTEEELKNAVSSNSIYSKVMSYLDNTLTQIEVSGDQYAYITGDKINVTGTLTDSDVKTVEIAYDGVTKYATVDGSNFVETDGTSHAPQGTLVNNGDGTYTYSIEFTVTKTDVLNDDIAIQVQDSKTWKQHTIKDKPVILIDTNNPKFFYLNKLDNTLANGEHQDGVFKKLVKAVETDMGKTFGELTNTELESLVKIYDETMKFSAQSSETFEEVQHTRGYLLTGQIEGELYEYIRYLSSVPHLVNVFENVEVGLDDIENYIGHSHYTDAFDYNDDIEIKVTPSSLEIIKAIAIDYRDSVSYNRGDKVPEKETYAKWLSLTPYIDAAVKAVEDVAKERHAEELENKIAIADEKLEELRLQLVTEISDGTWLTAYKDAVEDLADYKDNLVYLKELRDVEQQLLDRETLTYTDYNVAVESLREKVDVLVESPMQTYLDERTQKLEVIAGIYTNIEETLADGVADDLETSRELIDNLPSDFALISVNREGEAPVYEGYSHEDNVTFLEDLLVQAEVILTTMETLDELEGYVLATLVTGGVLDDTSLDTVVLAVATEIQGLKDYVAEKGQTLTAIDEARILEIENKVYLFKELTEQEEVFNTTPEDMTSADVVTLLDKVKELGEDTFSSGEFTYRDLLQERNELLLDSVFENELQVITEKLTSIIETVSTGGEVTEDDRALIAELTSTLPVLEERGADVGEVSKLLNSVVDLVGLQDRIKSAEQAIDMLDIDTASPLINDLTTGDTSVETVLTTHAEFLDNSDLELLLTTALNTLNEKLGYLTQLVKTEEKILASTSLNSTELDGITSAAELLQTNVENSTTNGYDQFVGLYADRVGEVSDKLNAYKGLTGLEDNLDVLTIEGITSAKDTVPTVRDAIALIDEALEQSSAYKGVLNARLTLVEGKIALGEVLKDLQDNKNNYSSEELLDILASMKEDFQSILDGEQELGLETPFDNDFGTVLDGLEEELRNIIGLELVAVEAIEKAIESFNAVPYVDTVTEEDIVNAQLAIDAIADGQNKDKLQSELDQLKDERNDYLALVEQATTLTEKAEGSLALKDYNKAVDATEELRDSAEKTDLLQRLEILEAKIQIKDLIKEFEENEFTYFPSQLDTIYTTIESLVDTTVKKEQQYGYTSTYGEEMATVLEGLKAKLDTLTQLEQSLADSLEETKQAFTSNPFDDEVAYGLLDNFKSLVDTAPQGVIKDLYADQLEVLTLTKEEYSLLLAKADELVGLFEETLLLEDYDKASLAVELLLDSEEKTDYTERLNTLYGVVSEAVEAVATAESHITRTNYEKAFVLVDALKESKQKTALVEKLANVLWLVKYLEKEQQAKEEANKPQEPEVVEPPVDIPVLEEVSEDEKASDKLEELLSELIQEVNLEDISLKELLELINTLPPSDYTDALKLLVSKMIEIENQHNKGVATDIDTLNGILETINELSDSLIKDALLLHGTSLKASNKAIVSVETAEKELTQLAIDLATSHVEDVINKKLKPQLENRLDKLVVKENLVETPVEQVEFDLQAFLADLDNKTRQDFADIGVNIPEELYTLFIAELKDLIATIGVENITLQDLLDLVSYLQSVSEIQGNTLDIDVLSPDGVNRGDYEEEVVEETTTSPNKVVEETPKQEPIVNPVETEPTLEEQNSYKPVQSSNASTQSTESDYNENPSTPVQYTALTDSTVQEMVETMTSEEVQEFIEEDILFKPKSTVTKGQYAVLLAKAAGLEPVKVENGTGLWYEGYIKVITDKGIMEANSDGTFDYNSQIDMAELQDTLKRLLRFVAMSKGTESSENGQEGVLRTTIGTNREEDLEQPLDEVATTNNTYKE